MSDPAILLFSDHRGHDGIMRAVRNGLSGPLLDDQGEPLNLADYPIDEYGIDYLSDAISDGEVYVRANSDGTLYCLEWDDGAMWAVHPNAEYCPRDGIYKHGPDSDTVEYWIGEHYASAIFNGDSSGLSDEEWKRFERWHEGLDKPIENYGIRDEFEACEITGMMGNCIKVW